MKKILGALAALSLALNPAYATTIEGYTPTGRFQTVGVTDTGYLQVAMIQAIVGANVLKSGQKTVTGTPVQIYPVDQARLQSVIVNTDSFFTVWLGTAGVSKTTGLQLLAGQSFSPDTPNSYTGALYAVSSGAVVTVSFLTVDP